jgi:hypothetical protein
MRRRTKETVTTWPDRVETDAKLRLAGKEISRVPQCGTPHAQAASVGRGLRLGWL